MSSNDGRQEANRAFVGFPVWHICGVGWILDGYVELAKVDFGRWSNERQASQVGKVNSGDERVGE